MNINMRLLPAVRERSVRWLALLLLAFAMHSPGWAQRPPNVTDGEMALLPVYCPDTQGFKYSDAATNPSPNSKAWVAKLGKAFWAVHHHCWGLIKARRAMATGVAPPIRTGLLKAAISDYEYVIRHSDRTFLLLPDVYLKMAEAHLLLGDVPNAAASYEASRGLKPDFWPAYAGWAEALQKSGNRAAALKHLEEGMRNAPSARPLQQQYQRYGGDLKKFLASLPAPVAAASAAASAPSVPAASLPTDAASAASAAASR